MSKGQSTNIQISIWVITVKLRSMQAVFCCVEVKITNRVCRLYETVLL